MCDPAVRHSGADVQIRQSAETGYRALNELLHPQTNEGGSGGASAGLSGLVDSYSSKSDWVHAVLWLGGDGKSDRLGICTGLIPPESPENLQNLLPIEVMSIADANAEAPSLPEVKPLRVRTPSPGEADPTPMPRHGEDDSYFDQAPTASSPEATRGALVSDASDRLRQIVDDPQPIHASSTSHFLRWRASQASLPAETSKHLPRRLEVPHPTNNSSPSSSVEGIVPTVGRGEWEANYSRRLASKRRRHSARSNRHHGPLFPIAHGVSRIGLVGLVESAFAPVRAFLESNAAHGKERKMFEDSDDESKGENGGGWGKWVIGAVLVGGLVFGVGLSWWASRAAQ